MRNIRLFILLFTFQLSAQKQSMTAEDYYVAAFNEMSDMLAGRDTLSIKRAVFLAEWAYYEGNLDYKTDFCDEIDRIVNFIHSLYNVNKLYKYKTGKQMALNVYFFLPYSGNNHMPYTYDLESFLMEHQPWDRQFVSKVLKTHKGQCRSIPWMYKILANELDAEAYIARAPSHCYIMYKDEDNLTPEEWINLEVITNKVVPSWWIKKDYEICDSAVIAGTYMTPMTDTETVASQMAELAIGYKEKFHRYDEFTYYCASRSLEFYPMHPKAWVARGKSIDQLVQNHLERNGNIIDNYAAYLIRLADETKWRLDKTYFTEESKESKERRKQEALEALRSEQEKTQTK